MVDINKLDEAVNITSLLGWSLIMYEAFFENSLQMWLSGLTFIIIGIGFIAVSGVTALINILDDGKIDTIETLRLLTALLGFASVIVGLASLPISILSGLRIPALVGARGLIAMFAFFFVLVKTVADFTSKRK